jgi:hypothetical protein
LRAEFRRRNAIAEVRGQIAEVRTFMLAVVGFTSEI